MFLKKINRRPSMISKPYPFLKVEDKFLLLETGNSELWFGSFTLDQTKPALPTLYILFENQVLEKLILILKEMGEKEICPIIRIKKDGKLAIFNVSFEIPSPRWELLIKLDTDGFILWNENPSAALLAEVWGNFSMDDATNIFHMFKQMGCLLVASSENKLSQMEYIVCPVQEMAADKNFLAIVAKQHITVTQ
jgi:hypothetical protein